MEFRVITDLESDLPAVIDFNFDELRSELSEKLAYYKALVVTADGVRAGKEERARLNKLRNAVEDRRKEVKKQYLAPYEAFEAKCKELTGMIDDAAGSIDKQVKAFEEAEREDKRMALLAVYENGIGELSGLVAFEKLFNAKWLNKGVTLAAASGELCSAMQKIASDVKVLRAMQLECEAQVLDTYLTTLDMSAALAEKNRFEARQEQLKKLAEEPHKAPGIRTVPGHGALSQTQAQQAAEAMDHAYAHDAAQEETRTVKVVFYDTTAAFRAEMKALTEKYSIKYGGIK